MIDGHDNQIHHDPHTHSLVAALVFGRRGVHVSGDRMRAGHGARGVLGQAVYQDEDRVTTHKHRQAAG